MKIMALKYLCFTLLVLSSIFIIYANGDDEQQCLYKILVKTGTAWNAGTQSKISLTVANSTRHKFVIPDLEGWSLMPPGHDFFQRENLDYFGGKGPCLNWDVCEIKLTSDGTGISPDWYCDYVDVVSIEVTEPQYEKHYVVDRWLALDRPPNTLNATVDLCPVYGGKGGCAM